MVQWVITVAAQAAAVWGISEAAVAQAAMQRKEPLGIMEQHLAHSSCEMHYGCLKHLLHQKV
jgi:hypothetical protein